MEFTNLDYFLFYGLMMVKGVKILIPLVGIYLIIQYYIRVRGITPSPNAPIRGGTTPMEIKELMAERAAAMGYFTPYTLNGGTHRTGLESPDWPKAYGEVFEDLLYEGVFIESPLPGIYRFDVKEYVKSN